MNMPFGKFKGTPLEELEDGYLAWLHKADNLFPPLRKAVDAEYARRFAESGPPPAKPSSSGYGAPQEGRGLSAQEARLLVNVLRTGFDVLVSESESNEAEVDELEALRTKVSKLTWSTR
jgi:hypothetical protein